MRILTIIPFIVAFGMLTSCGSDMPAQTETEYAQPGPDAAVRTESGEAGTAFVNVASPKTVSKGKIESMKDISVYSQMQEQIVKLNIKDGTTVRKGDVIVVLDEERLLNQLVQARNSFEQAEYMYEEILVGQGYSIDEIEKVPEYVLRISKVKSGYNTSEASLRQAERNYEKRMITAPESGTVTNVEVHQYDLPQSTTPLCKIFDPDHMKVVFNILENERGRISLGSIVSVTTVAYSEEVHSAKVNLISPRVDENGMIRIEAELTDNHNLVPGMTAFVNL